MSITLRKYVDITSGVGAGAEVRQRDLIGRLFTTNDRVPVDGVLEMTTIEDVGTYFGTTSQEYLRAQFYFSWISKLISRAQKISFARWADAAVAPKIYGARTLTTLSQWQAITAGKLNITMGANTNALTAIDFSEAASLADVATTLQTAIRAGTGTQFATAVVTYDAIAGAFNLAGSVAEAAPISVQVISPADPNDIALRLGWGPTAVFSPGVDVTSLTDTLAASVDISTNFASFLFIPTLTDEEVIEVATWNATNNVEYIYTQRVDDTNRVALAAALLGFAGTTITYAPDPAQYDEMAPMIILAATDYTKRNSVQNYMYQQFPTLTPKVTTTPLSNVMDLDRLNYYGVTQTAGQLIAFYQRGVMMGGATAPVDQNVYANEIWLKDYARAALLALLIAQARVPANPQGEGQVLVTLQEPIDAGLFNGAISVGKTLTTQQKLYINEMTGDDLAWYQVQNRGYWLDCNMQSEVTQDGRTEWKAVYTLIYSKDDTIRKVEGTHVLI